MTAPEETDCEVQDWTCTFLERKNQKQKSAGSGRIFSLPGKRKAESGMTFLHSEEGAAQRYWLPSWGSACSSWSPFGPQAPSPSSPGCKTAGRGELARLFLLREHRKWQPFGTWWEVHPAREVCACSMFAFLEAMNNQGKRGKKRRRNIQRQNEKKRAKKSFARRNFIWFLFYCGFFCFGYSFLCAPWASLEDRLFH